MTGLSVYVGPYWTSVDVETETAFSLRPIGPYWTTLRKQSTVGSYILRVAHNTGGCGVGDDSLLFCFGLNLKFWLWPTFELDIFQSFIGMAYSEILKGFYLIFKTFSNVC